MGYGIEDAQELLDIYIAQVREKFADKEYVIGLRDQYGQRFTIEIELTGKGAAAGRTYHVFSGWILDINGTLKLSTPFTGFAS